MTISVHDVSYDTNNPFRFGSAVSGKIFADREDELPRILGLAKARKNILVRAEKGMGKSSLLAELARTSYKDFELVCIGCFGITCNKQLLQTMTRKLMWTYREKDGTLDQLGWELLKSTRLRLATLQEELLGTTAKDEIRTLLPPTRREVEGSIKEKKKIEIKMCPDCGKAVKWVEKYSRYYCYGCRKYLSRQRKVRGTIDGPATQMDSACPSCGGETSFVEKYSDYYCVSCKRYQLTQLRKKRVDEFTHSDMIEILDLSQNIASQKGQHVVVVFDDFQEILIPEFEGLLKAMRLRFEMHTDASYIFSACDGKEVHDSFGGKEGTFYKFTETVNLGPVANDKMEKFLMDRFRSGGGKLARTHARRIVALSGGFPGHAQCLAHGLFHLSKEPTVEDVDYAIRSAITQRSHEYSSTWRKIRSPLQRRYLVALVTEPLASHGADFIDRHDLKSRSHVQRIERQLETDGIIKNGEVRDPLFVLWLRSIAGLL